MQYKIYIPCLILLASIFLAACGNNNTQNQENSAGDWAGFEMSAVTGSDFQHAVKKDETDRITEEGFVLNGKKNGTWITFLPEGGIKTIENYIDGRVEGISLVLDKRSQVIKKTFYMDGQFHGPNTTYKFGRPQETIPYKHGNVDGKVIRYYNNGRVMEEIDFKDGLQHGLYLHYNTDETLDMRYEYKNGKKISGGMVKPDQDDSPKN
jgi:antitoxin component YwqK of YwqJK toxin-antitoxin module